MPFHIPIVAIAIAVLLFVANIFWVVRLPDRERRIRMRLAALKSVKPVGVETTPSRFRRLEVIGRVLAESPLVGAKEQQKMTDLLASAGIHGADKLRIFVTAKAGLAVFLAAGVWVGLSFLGWTPETLTYRIIIVVAPALLGWRLPDMVVGRLVKKRRRKLAEGIADALDLLVICVEAGLGLEQALDRVSRDIEIANPVISHELANTVAEMRVLPQMRDALDNLARSSGLPAIQSVVTTLVQGIQYGTPLSQSLRILSAEMRAKNLIALEERAARLPVLLMLPVILFILPTLFLVIGGPVALQVMKVMGGK